MTLGPGAVADMDTEEDGGSELLEAVAVVVASPSEVTFDVRVATPL